MIDEGGPDRVDGVILGSGFGGAVLATLLARHDVSVLVIDAGVHPRFAVGESTIPHTSLLPLRNVSQQ